MNVTTYYWIRSIKSTICIVSRLYIRQETILSRCKSCLNIRSCCTLNLVYAHYAIVLLLPNNKLLLNRLVELLLTFCLWRLDILVILCLPLRSQFGLTLAHINVFNCSYWHRMVQRFILYLRAVIFLTVSCSRSLISYSFAWTHLSLNSLLSKITLHNILTWFHRFWLLSRSHLLSWLSLLGCLDCSILNHIVLLMTASSFKLQLCQTTSLGKSISIIDTLSMFKLIWLLFSLLLLIITNLTLSLIPLILLEAWLGCNWVDWSQPEILFLTHQVLVHIWRHVHHAKLAFRVVDCTLLLTHLRMVDRLITGWLLSSTWPWHLSLNNTILGWSSIWLQGLDLVRCSTWINSSLSRCLYAGLLLVRSLPILTLSRHVSSKDHLAILILMSHRTRRSILVFAR